MKKFETPVVEVERFEIADVIATSIETPTPSANETGRV